MHLYYIYGFKVISDILLVNATHYAGQAYKSELYLEYIDITNVGTTWRPTLLRKNDEHILSLGDHVIYYISAKKRKIIAHAADPLLVESTLFNLPFAVYAMASNSLLLHSSVLTHNSKLEPIFASKGTGKTTLTAALSKYLPFLSDDTLYTYLQEGAINTDAGSAMLKMNKDSADALGFIPISKKLNIQNKGYYLPNNIASETIHYKMHSLFFLSRGRQNNIEIKKIDSIREKEINLHVNVCGAESLGYEYCKYVRSCRLFEQIIGEMQFYKLIIPDDLNNINRVAFELFEMLKSKIYSK